MVDFCNRPHGGKIRVKLESVLETLYKLAVAHKIFKFMLINSEKVECMCYFKILLNHNFLFFDELICLGNKFSQRQFYLKLKAQIESEETRICFNCNIKDDRRIDTCCCQVETA